MNGANIITKAESSAIDSQSFVQEITKEDFYDGNTDKFQLPPSKGLSGFIYNCCKCSING